MLLSHQMDCGLLRLNKYYLLISHFSLIVYFIICEQVEAREDKQTPLELKMKLWEFSATHQRYSYTVVSQKRVHGWCSLHWADIRGWALFCETMVLVCSNCTIRYLHKLSIPLSWHSENINTIAKSFLSIFVCEIFCCNKHGSTLILCSITC